MHSKFSKYVPELWCIHAPAQYPGGDFPGYPQTQKDRHGGSQGLVTRGERGMGIFLAFISIVNLRKHFLDLADSIGRIHKGA